MGTNECSQPVSKSSWDSQDFGDVSMVLKMTIFASPPGHNELTSIARQRTRDMPSAKLSIIWVTNEPMCHHGILWFEIENLTRTGIFLIFTVNYVMNEYFLFPPHFGLTVKYCCDLVDGEHTTWSCDLAP